MKRAVELARSRVSAIESGGRPLAAEPSEREIERREALVDEAWVVLGELFGAHKLERAWGTEPPAAWRVALSGLGPADIARGVDALVESGATWPPSAPEFVALCRERQRDAFGDCRAARMPLERGLPEPPSLRLARRRAADRGLDEAFAILGARRRRGPIVGRDDA